MTMTVALSESDIGSIKVGKPATVSIDALSGVQLGAKVTAISPVGSTSSGVVSYDVMLTLTQSNPQVRPGMSATASIIIAQASGVTVPNQAVTGSGSTGTVNVVDNGKVTPTRVIVGLRGATRTEIITGVSAGENLQVTITLPALGTSTSSSTGSGTLGGTGLGGLGRAFGGGGFGGGGLGALLRRGGG
jgi:hypothetical protein